MDCSPQASLSMGFSRQEYWSGFSSPSPRTLPYPKMEPACLMYLALVGGFFTTSATWEARKSHSFNFFFFFNLMKLKQNQEYLHLNSHLQSSVSSFLSVIFLLKTLKQAFTDLCVCVCERQPFLSGSGCWPLTDDHCHSF